jgi:hypothetical protein
MRPTKPIDQDWDSVFERLLSFMSQDVPIVWDHRPLLSDLAAERLGRAIHDEPNTRYDFVWPPVAVVRERLLPIFEAIEAREARVPGAIEAFSHGLGGLHHHHKLHQVIILEWLQDLQLRGMDTPGRLIAEIRLWPWGDSATRCQPPLVDLLNHTDSLVRAVAAHELGSTLEDIEPEFPTEWAMAARVLDDVKRAEISSPGVAGAFIWGLPHTIRDDVRLEQWVFDVLIEREGDEPNVPYFNSLEWVAAEEVFSKSPEWIQTLASAGREGLADWLALSTEVRSPEVSSRLVTMTERPDDWTARAAATCLALYYAKTTPAAGRRGFVSVIDDHPLLRAFAIYNHDDLRHPRIMVLYPRHPRRSLSLAEADAAVDLIAPPALRGEEQTKRRPIKGRQRREFNKAVYVTYDLAGRTSKRPGRIEIVGNGIKGAAWDPIALLRDWKTQRP